MVIVASLPCSRAFDIVHNGSTWTGYMATEQGNNIYKLTFDGDCSGFVNSNNSQEAAPANISYSAPGTYPIELTAFSSNGNFDTYMDTVVVRDASALQVSFSTSNACIDNENVFSASTNNDSDVLSWNWDFGDSDSGSGQVVNHKYQSTGTYQVQLEISSKSNCVSSISKTIPIYESPISDFNVPTEGLCSNSELSFTNTSNVLNADSAIFSWNYHAELVDTTVNGEYIFNSSGIKTITLISEITGCVDSSSQTINVLDGPLGSFHWTNNCYGDSVQFINESELNNVTYQWGLGYPLADSSLYEQKVKYDTIGVYQVQLSVTSQTNGCATVVRDSLNVTNTPFAGIDYPTPIIENISQNFFGVDLTDTKDSILTWNWDFGGAGSFNDKNPNVSFPKQDTLEISLHVETSQNCSDVIVDTIVIDEAEKPSLEISHSDSICISEILSITNQSVNATNYQWDFCHNDLSATPSVVNSFQTVNGSFSNSVTLINDEGMWYGFISNRNNNKLIRLD
jgi:PKD repeat protein